MIEYLLEIVRYEFQTTEVGLKMVGYVFDIDEYENKIVEAVFEIVGEIGMEKKNN